jgi:hypothetical protein
MILLMRSICILALLTSGLLPGQQEGKQAPSKAAEETVYEFFSGTIQQLPEGKLVVARAVLGKAAESRSFLITAETKVEGKLRMKARVTVGFKSSDDGDVAVRIIVRTQQPKK